MQTVNLADPEFNVSGAIDLILRVETAKKLLSTENSRKAMVYGWVVSGKQPNHAGAIVNTSHNITFDLKQFWELEENPEANKNTSEGIACETFKRYYQISSSTPYIDCRGSFLLTRSTHSKRKNGNPPAISDSFLLPSNLA